MKRKLTLEDVCVRIERWEKRVRRAENALSKLNTQRRRLERKAKLVATAKVAPAEPSKKWVVDRHGVPSKVEPRPEWVLPGPEPGSLDIPDYLKRRPQHGGLDDARAAAEIRQELKDKKRTKALVRVEKMKAKQSGEARKMPLQGKAALAHLKSLLT